MTDTTPNRGDTSNETGVRSPTDYSDRSRAPPDALGPGRPMKVRKPPARHRLLRRATIVALAGLAAAAVAWSSNGLPPEFNDQPLSPAVATMPPSEVSDETRLKAVARPPAERPVAAIKSGPGPEASIPTPSPVSDQPRAPAVTSRSDVTADPHVSDRELTSRQDIAELQRLLARLDLRPGPPDGILGGRTVRAIRLYQRYASLPDDGKASAGLLDELRAVVALMP